MTIKKFVKMLEKSNMNPDTMTIEECIHEVFGRIDELEINPEDSVLQIYKEYFNSLDDEDLRLKFEMFKDEYEIRCQSSKGEHLGRIMLVDKYDKPFFCNVSIRTCEDVDRFKPHLHIEGVDNDFFAAVNLKSAKYAQYHYNNNRLNEKSAEILAAWLSIPNEVSPETVNHDGTVMSNWQYAIYRYAVKYAGHRNYYGDLHKTIPQYVRLPRPKN